MKKLTWFLLLMIFSVAFPFHIFATATTSALGRPIVGKVISPFPTPMHCGGFIKNAPTCPAGYTCVLGKTPDVGGVCEPNLISLTPTPPITYAPVSENWDLGNQNLFSTILSFLAHIFHF